MSNPRLQYAARGGCGRYAGGPGAFESNERAYYGVSERFSLAILASRFGLFGVAFFLCAAALGRLGIARRSSGRRTREALLGLSVICLASTPTPAAQAPTRILFVGNSLTTANDLPGLVERIARAAGDRFECTTVAFPDHGLEEHWSRGDAQRAIRKGGWTFVVFQQGPSALPESRVLLRQYARRFDAEVRRAGARTALYMVWPSTARRGDFDAVSMSYSIAANDVGALLLPAGDAWRAAWRRESTVSLYAGDGFHPSLLGSYLAALVVYQGLSGKPAPILPALISTTPVMMTLLHEAAAEAITRR